MQTAQNLIIQQPAEPATELVLLLHGVGATAESMAAVGQCLAARNRRALVVSLAGLDPSDISDGRQWFSIQGVTEANRQGRVDQAMPRFMAAIAQWQKTTGIPASHTTLVGFSQGAIMALEASKLAPAPAHRIVAIAGRYASLPAHAPAATVHLLHGTADTVMPVALSEAAAHHLAHLGAQVTLDVAPGVGHMPHPVLLTALGQHWRSPAPADATNTGH